MREDLSLNQLRLSIGSALLTDDDVRAFHNGEPLLFHHGEPVAAEKLAFGGGLFLGLDLHGIARATTRRCSTWPRARPRRSIPNPSGNRCATKRAIVSC